MRPPLSLTTALLGTPLVCLLLLLFACNAHAYAPLSNSTLRGLAGPTPDFDLPSGSLLAPLLHPRVPGTPGSARAQEHFATFFATRLPAWALTWQNSTSRTPATGDREVPFANLILRRAPPDAADGDVAYLTLAAHYDTLSTLDGFVGAVDSAAPCAVLMHVAAAVEPALQRKWAAGHDALEEPAGLQIILFDGEEPWVKWSDEDSLYGSRSLAEKWAAEIHPPQATHRTPIDAISLLVLLDLLGAPDPKVHSYFASSHWAYQGLADVEHRMRALDLLESRPSHGRGHFLTDRTTPAHRIRMPPIGVVLDDHVPFVVRGVQVLHLVPVPFPADVWHLMEDDGEHLDLPTVRDWARIVAGFAGEWLELEGFLDGDEGEVERLEL